MIVSFSKSQRYNGTVLIDDSIDHLMATGHLDKAPRDPSAVDVAYEMHCRLFLRLCSGSSNSGVSVCGQLNEKQRKIEPI